MVNTRVRFKVDMNKDNKAKVNLRGQQYRSGQEATLPDADAKKLVDGGYADYLDQGGNVISEKNVRSENTPADQDAATKGKAAKTVPEDQRAKPAEQGPLDNDE